MPILVKLFGIIMVAFGGIFLTSPEVIKKYMIFWTKGRRVYAGGGLSILVGIVLLLAAFQCRVAWFVTIIGIWALIKGILLFILGPERFTSIINWWAARSPVVLRIIALLVLIFGALFIYSV